MSIDSEVLGSSAQDTDLSSLVDETQLGIPLEEDISLHILKKTCYYVSHTQTQSTIYLGGIFAKYLRNYLVNAAISQINAYRQQRITPSLKLGLSIFIGLNCTDMLTTLYYLGEKGISYEQNLLARMMMRHIGLVPGALAIKLAGISFIYKAITN